MYSSLPSSFSSYFLPSPSTFLPSFSLFLSVFSSLSSRMLFTFYALLSSSFFYAYLVLSSSLSFSSLASPPPSFPLCFSLRSKHSFSFSLVYSFPSIRYFISFSLSSFSLLLPFLSSFSAPHFLCFSVDNYFSLF